MRLLLLLTLCCLYKTSSAINCFKFGKSPSERVTESADAPVGDWSYTKREEEEEREDPDDDDDDVKRVRRQGSEDEDEDAPGFRNTSVCVSTFYEIHWPSGESRIEAFWTTQNRTVGFDDAMTPRCAPQTACSETFDVTTGAHCEWLIECECYTDLCNDLHFPREQYFLKDHRSDSGSNAIRVPTPFFEQISDAYIIFITRTHNDAGKYKDWSVYWQPKKCHQEFVNEPFGKRYLRSIDVLKNPLVNGSMFSLGEGDDSGPVWCGLVIYPMETAYGIIRIPPSIDNAATSEWEYWRKPGARIRPDDKAITLLDNRLRLCYVTKNDTLTNVPGYHPWRGDEIVVCACPLDNCNHDALNYEIRSYLPNHLKMKEQSLASASYSNDEIFCAAVPKSADFPSPSFVFVFLIYFTFIV